MPAESQPPAEAEDALEKPVSLSGEYRPFGELGPDDARRLSTELRSTGGWGPLSKAAGVAQAWQELAEEIENGDGERVRDLAPERVVEFARRLWVLPPPGGFL
jgi:hypothetical protein